MHQPLKTQSYRQTAKSRCKFRTNHISWCRKLAKICISPNDYNNCTSYQAKKPAKQTLSLKTSGPRQTILIGTKIGRCDICKATTKTLLLKYGFTLCEDCLTICTTILEQLELEKTDQAPKSNLLVTKQTNQPRTKPNEAQP